MDVLRFVSRSPLLSQPPLAIAVNVIVFFAFVLIAAAVVSDFLQYHRQRRGVVSSDTSLVETGSMTAFFVVYYLVVRFRVLEVPVLGGFRMVMIVTGLVLLVLGVVFNIWGRVVLGSQWANQIKIYEGHHLVTTGPFSVVRHPLYASLIWIFVGGSLVYSNPLALVLALGVFVPMMYARAKKEDTLLEEAFGEEFDRYRSQVGMLLPGIRG